MRRSRSRNTTAARERLLGARAEAGGAGRLRIALYSHDALGLGHIRRNLAIAHTASRHCRPDILLLTGAPHVAVGHLPTGCDLVALPSLSKDAEGRYAASHLSMERDEMVALRRSILEAAVGSFAPDVLIVDKHPRGFAGEMEQALRAARAAGARIVLGLRDVLDDPETASEQWRRDGSAAALHEWYDEIWVYGDLAVHDTLAGLEVPEHLASRITHTGYLATGRATLTRPSPMPVAEPYVLAMVGGGADGAEVATAFARATYPRGHHGVLVTGPQMPARDRDRLRSLARERDDLEVHEYVEDGEALLARASAVVAMGGYNTVCEALAHDRDLLVVPRIRPRAEQLVRARALAATGRLDLLHPDDLSAEALSDWLSGTASRAGSRQRLPVDLDGLARIGELLTVISESREAIDVA